jgi:cation diffusion facilitator CzcD-associated flavoprotein CzcO
MTEIDYEVAIIGAGPGGIAVAYQLRRHGITDFIFLERADDFGGSWRDNHYPGLAVDIPTLWYQFSFARNPNWSRLFAPGPEIQCYLRDTARHLGLYDHLAAGAEVTRQVWDEHDGVWRLEVKDKATISARYVISAVGGYINTKSNLAIQGADDFDGVIMHPNAWDHRYELRGKQVAIVGTGSSGLQIASAVSSRVGTLEIYQRTPAWVLPKPDFAIPPLMRAILRIPGVIAAVNLAGRDAMDAALAPIFHLFPRLPATVLIRIMPIYDAYCRLLYRAYLRCVVHDPQTRRELIPQYGILAKRPVISSSFLPILNQPSTRLITTPITHITKTGIQTADGAEHSADLIVMATGYELFTDPETYRTGTVVGRDGFDLAEYYNAHGLRSYGGAAHPGLPNRWEIVGPLGFIGIAWTDFVETMAVHAVRIIAESRTRANPVVTVRRSAFDRWHRKMQRQGKAVHLYLTACNPGLNTYFVNSQNHTVYHRPQTIAGSRRFSRRSPLSDYDFAPGPAATGPQDVRPSPRAEELSA